jgi:hypothetical protein
MQIHGEWTSAAAFKTNTFRLPASAETPTFKTFNEAGLQTDDSTPKYMASNRNSLEIQNKRFKKTQ